MKIKKVEKNEKPDYDTKNERKNKFLKLVCDHKKIIIVVLVVVILTIGGLYRVYWKETEEVRLQGASPIGFVERVERVNEELSKFEGKISGSDVKELIRLVKKYNDAGIFPNYIALNIDNSLKSYDEDTDVVYKDEKYNIQNSNKYKVEINAHDEYGFISEISITEN